jgi:hypothetical protein
MEKRAFNDTAKYNKRIDSDISGDPTSDTSRTGRPNTHSDESPSPQGARPRCAETAALTVSARQSFAGFHHQIPLTYVEHGAEGNPGYPIHCNSGCTLRWHQGMVAI